MKRIFLPLAILFAWFNSASIFAQEPAENELEFVRQLRAKGWGDLAKKKIELLLKRKDPVLDAALPLELARINIAAARQLDPSQRIGLFTEAHGQLENYIKKNKGKVGAALASLELARLTSYHAQALLSQAMREEDNKSRHEKARPAEAKFIQAGKELEAAGKALAKAAADPANSALKKTLDKESQQARLDAAINYFDQARTYIDKGKDAVNAARANTIEKARKLFLTLAGEESDAISALANAWVMKCSIEQTNPDDAVKYYKYVMKKIDDPVARPAVRLAKYFYIQDITLPRSDEVETIGTHIASPKNPKAKPVPPIEQLHKVEKECDAWVKAYGIKKNYESEGVLFEAGIAYLTEASLMQQLAEASKKKPTAKDEKDRVAVLKKAEAKFDQLAKLEGDMAERARQMTAYIRRSTLPSTGELKTFSDYLLRAMIDRDKVRELSNKIEDAKSDEAAKKIEEDRKKKLREVIVALNKGLKLVTVSDSPSKINDARYYLCGAYLTSGDPYRAAVVAEALARKRPATSRSTDGAATAIATYAMLNSRRPGDLAIRTRLLDMVHFVLAPENKAWSGDPVASLAHYHLAMLDKKDNKLKSAVQHLEKIQPGFTDYIYTQGQLVFIAESARMNSNDPKEQAWYLAAAKAAINRMPKFNLKDDSPSVIMMYFYAKIEMSKFLYADAIAEMNARQELKAVQQCKAMAKYIEGLQAEFATVPPKTITEKNHEQLDFTLRVMLKYADLGLAEAKFRGDSKDRFDDVLKATSNVVTAMLAEAAKKQGNAPIIKKDNAVIGKILGLALRASVQKGDVKKGKAILDVLQRLKGEGNDEGAGAGAVVSELLRDIAGQIKIMTDSADKNLDKTKGNYISFLDVIAKDFEKKGLDNNNATMLAHAYLSLHVPCKAAENFAKIKAPADLDKKFVKPKMETDEQMKARLKRDEEFSRYWASQLEYIRALRGCKEKDSLKTAEAVIKTILTHPNARFQIQAMMEKNHLLDDAERYREEYAGWQGIMKMPSIAQRLGDKEVQKIYFTSYFYTARTLCKIAVHDKQIKDPAKLTTAAANMILRLEFTKGKDGWTIAEPLFNEFIKDKDAEQFKKEYDRLKATRSGAALKIRRPALAAHVPVFRRDYALDWLLAA